METEHVVIVGAGVAGLTLAWRLKSRGVVARVLEARSRVGGRTVAMQAGADRFDLGATWVWQTEDAVLRLVDELGLETFPSHRGGLDLYESTEGIQQVRLPPSPVPELRIEGGTAAIAQALAERVDVDLSRPVRRVAADGDDVVLELDDTSIRARNVVLAVPPALAAAMIGPEAGDHRELLARVPVWMGDMAKIVAIYDTPFWLDADLSGRVFSHRGPMVEIHDISGPDRHAAPALFGFVPKSHAQGDWQNAARDQLVRLFGAQAAAPRAFEVKAWWQELETTPAAYHPAQQLIGQPFLRQPLLNGHVHLASTETAAMSAGHLDGAVRRAESLADFFVV